MTSHDSMIIELSALSDAHEEAAKHLFVVCGQPADQFEFEAAWKKEDPVWYHQWVSLNNFIQSL